MPRFQIHTFTIFFQLSKKIKIPFTQANNVGLIDRKGIDFENLVFFFNKTLVTHKQVE